jgi:CHRD domain
MKRLYLGILLIVATLAFPTAVLADSELEANARLTGSQEVPPNGSAMTGNVDVEINTERLRFALRVRRNTNEIFAAHIHCAPPGVNGPVGVTLFMGSFTAERGLLARGPVTAPDPGNGCGWDSIADVAVAIQSGNAYVNVHTTAASGGIPSGEIRGNLIVGDDD